MDTGKSGEPGHVSLRAFWRRLMSDWKVELVNDSTKELEVDFTGPSGSAISDEVILSVFSTV